jgi:hypothetical protein
MILDLEVIADKPTEPHSWHSLNPVLEAQQLGAIGRNCSRVTLVDALVGPSKKERQCFGFTPTV